MCLSVLGIRTNNRGSHAAALCDVGDEHVVAVLDDALKPAPGGIVERLERIGLDLARAFRKIGHLDAGGLERFADVLVQHIGTDRADHAGWRDGKFIPTATDPVGGGTSQRVGNGDDRPVVAPRGADHGHRFRHQVGLAAGTVDIDNDRRDAGIAGGDAESRLEAGQQGRRLGDIGNGLGARQDWPIEPQDGDIAGLVDCAGCCAGVSVKDSARGPFAARKARISAIW
jgi:hypothetical protein